MITHAGPIDLRLPAGDRLLPRKPPGNLLRIVLQDESIPEHEHDIVADVYVDFAFEVTRHPVILLIDSSAGVPTVMFFRREMWDSGMRVAKYVRYRPALLNL